MRNKMRNRSVRIMFLFQLRKLRNIMRTMKTLNHNPNLKQYLNQSLNPNQNQNPKQDQNLIVVEEEIVEVVVEEMVEMVEVTKEILEVVDRGGGGRDQGDFGDP